MKQIIRVAVVLLNWKDSSRTVECLDRLAKLQTMLEVFVVDNGSPLNEVQRLREKYYGVTFLHSNENRGFSGGNNIALKQILSFSEKRKNEKKFILLLNTDAHIDDNNLKVLLNTALSDNEIGVVGPLLAERKNGDVLFSAGGRDPALYSMTYLDRGKRVSSYTKEVYPVDYVSGTIALLPVETFQRVGLFDENYFFSCEMADLCQRMKKKQLKCVINPAAQGWHESGGPEKVRKTLYVYYTIRNRFRYIKKFKGKYKAFYQILWLLRVILFGAKKTIDGDLDSARAIWLAIRDGIFQRFGGRNDLFSRH